MFASTPPPTSQLDRLALAIYASDARITKEKANTFHYGFQFNESPRPSLEAQVVRTHRDRP